jgi:battenin
MREAGTTTGHLTAFWLMGLINNMAYVIMIAGAKSISSGGVGMVFICEIIPSLLIQLTGPYWYPFVSYHRRIHVASIAMALSFILVILGMRLSSNGLGLQLIGVCFAGIQSGLGESSLLAYTSYYNSRQALTCWSSGTGFSGVAGFTWVALFTHVFTLETTLLMALLLFPVTYITIFRVMFDHSEKYYPESEPLLHRYHSITDGFQISLSLWPYMIPMILVYTTEYAMQAGTWAAIGFPLEDPQARALFYRNSGFAYQCGVFLARSSGTLCQVHYTSGLFCLAFMQALMLVFFWCVAEFQFFYNWWLLCLCFFVGCIGGTVYLNSFTLLASEIVEKEFALAVASISSTIGILCADIVGLLLQGCLYSLHHLPGATVPVQC